MKSLFTLIVIAALGAGGFFFWRHWQHRGTEQDAFVRPTTALVEALDINFVVNVAGEIAPAEQVSVRPEINGRIASLPVDIGDKVKKGEILFTLDDQELENQRASSLTEIDRAKLQLEQAQRNFERNQQLYEQKLISQEVYENSRTDLDLAKNALVRSQRDLSVLEERLTKTQIKAPFDCTVLIRPVSVGQAVSGSGGVGGGTEVLAIADLNDMVINAHVNQADVTRLKIGESVDVEIEAVPGLKVTGLIDRIAPQATIKNNIKGFAARISIKNPDPRVQPGMTANVAIPVSSKANVPAVPLAAVFTEQEDRFVYVKHGDNYERRPVRIGVADYFNAEVLNGLKEGEVVALEQPPADSITNLAKSASSEKALQGAGPNGKGSRSGT